MSPQLLEQLIQCLGKSAVLDHPSVQEAYLIDQRGYYRGAASAVVRPASTKQVAEIVMIARQFGVSVVPQGGNTGLCGGATPDDSGSQLILSLEKLNTIRDVDTVDYSMMVEAGVILQNILDTACDHDLFFPLDLAAKGSCQIGGNLATNAGGINVLRYGNARDLVLGLEVVLADGSIWNGLSNLRKDNTGYDLKQLFLGSEGTLGIITAAVLKLFPSPMNRKTAMLVVSNPKAACRLLGTVRSISGDAVVSFEYIGREAMECVLSGMNVTDPFNKRYEHYVLIELASAAGGGILDGMLEQIMEQGMGSHGIVDGVLAQNERQREALWHIRELISEAQKGSVKNDVSVPISRLPQFLEKAAQCVEATSPGSRPCPFGHIGDGNVHYNILAPQSEEPADFRARSGEALIAAVTDLAMSMDGSFSAEHGIGQLRLGMMERYKSPEALGLMKKLKRSMDPAGVLNPGKIV
ncbi:MAG: putative FAD-linked oxidoreductase [Gammaproteobacteria bacterium]|nr:putative FAD-linked oxidoreductase [Gammaproteobacteria bacterium]